MRRSLIVMLAGPLVLAFATPARGQAPASTDRNTYTTGMAWFEGDFVLKLGGHFSTQMDIQIRSAADQEGQPDRNSWNVVDNPYQIVLRPWIHYDLGASGVRFSLSPMAYGAAWNYYEGSSTVAADTRTSLQVQYSSRASKVYLTNRLRYEFRWVGERTPVDGGWSIPSEANDNLFSPAHARGRLRYMLRGWIPLGRADLEPGAWYIATFDEIFIGMGSTVPSTNIFDQNRFYVGIGRQEKGKIRWEAGYMNQVQSRYNRAPDYNNLEVNHILATWLFFDDLAKAF